MQGFGNGRRVLARKPTPEPVAIHQEDDVLDRFGRPFQTDPSLEPRYRACWGTASRRRVVPSRRSRDAEKANRLTSETAQSCSPSRRRPPDFVCRACPQNRRDRDISAGPHLLLRAHQRALLWYAVSDVVDQDVPHRRARVHHCRRESDRHLPSSGVVVRIARPLAGRDGRGIARTFSTSRIRSDWSAASRLSSSGEHSAIRAQPVARWEKESI